MKPLATIRYRQVPWARRILGLFVVAWLNMALQPCAMAFGDANAAGCNPCPMAHSEEMSLQDSGEILDSESGVSRCAFVDDLNYDGRTTRVSLKDAPSDVPLGNMYVAAAALFATEWAVISTIRQPLYSPGYPPTFIVLYGVYLI